MAALLSELLLSALAVTGDHCENFYDRTQHSTTGVWRSVKDPRFGAVGDGFHDDTQALQVRCAVPE